MTERRTSQPAHDPRAASVQVGYWVVIALRPDSAPLRSYFGKVEAIDQHGIRLGIVDWTDDLPSSPWGFFAPWGQITAMLMASPDHDTKSFGESAAKWQRQ